MAYEAGDPIGTAVDINENNLEVENTISSIRYSRNAFDDSTATDNGFFYVRSSRTATYPDMSNIRLRIDNSAAELNRIRILDSDDTILCQLDDGGGTAYSPAILVTDEADGDERVATFYVPPSGEQYEWQNRMERTLSLFKKSAIRFQTYAIQGQTDCSTGDKVRVWESDFSGLLPEGTTLLTAELANAGLCGYDEEA